MNNKDIQDKLYEYHLETRHLKDRPKTVTEKMEYTHLGTMFNKDLNAVHTNELKSGQ